MFIMWPISAQTIIIDSPCISFIHALNDLLWISGLCDIAMIINTTSAHKFEQTRILKPVEHLTW